MSYLIDRLYGQTKSLYRPKNLQKLPSNATFENLATKFKVHLLNQTTLVHEIHQMKIHLNRKQGQV